MHTSTYSWTTFFYSRIPVPQDAHCTHWPAAVLPHSYKGPKHPHQRLELCSITRPAQLLRKHFDITAADSVRKALEGCKVVTLSTQPLLAPLAARSQLLTQTVPQEPHSTHGPAASFVPETMGSAQSLSAQGLGHSFFITAWFATVWLGHTAAVAGQLIWG